MPSRLAGFFMDSILGFLDRIQKGSIRMVKITAATYYLKGLQQVRRQCLVLLAALLCALLVAVAMVVIPVAVVLCLSVTPAVRLTLLGLLGVLYVVCPLWTASRLFSERNWIKFFKADELVAEAMNDD